MGDINSSSPTSAVTSRPGLMICTPSLKNPGLENYETFLRWTKLHFRDLVDIEPILGGKITRALQFITPGAVGRDGEYFNIIHASHHPIWLSPGYQNNSKRLDLENTRPLLSYEEPVNCTEGMMVFDICNALFSIYELLDPDTGSEYHLHPQLKNGEEKVLVAINVNGNRSSADNLLSSVVKAVEGLGKGKVYASLYEHKAEAQPLMHPTMEKTDVGGGEYLGLVAIVGLGEGLNVEHVRRLVEERVGKKEGLQIGVWREEVDVGERAAK